MVPLDFLVPSFGRCRPRVDCRDKVSSPLIEDADDEFVVVGMVGSRYRLCCASGSATWGILEAGGEAILLLCAGAVGFIDIDTFKIDGGEDWN